MFLRTRRDPESAILELRKTVPSCPINPDREADDLSCPVFSDLARFISSEAEVLHYVASREDAQRLNNVPDCMIFLDHALEDGDSAVRDMVTDCLESLSSCEWRGPD